MKKALISAGLLMFAVQVAAWLTAPVIAERYVKLVVINP